MPTVLPIPATPSIRIEPVTLRNFRFPNYKSFCNHCDWDSFEYMTKEEAEEVALGHADKCCDRINRNLAQEVEVEPFAAEDLPHGRHILLKDLRTMEVENVEVFDDEVMLQYAIGDLSSQIMVLPLGHIVKVVA